MRKVLAVLSSEAKGETRASCRGGVVVLEERGRMKTSTKVECILVELPVDMIAVGKRRTISSETFFSGG